MKNAITRTLSPTQLAMRAAVMTSISLAVFLFAACDSNTPSGRGDQNPISGPQSLNKSHSNSASVSTSPVPLGSASTFAVLGATGVTNVGASLITGDLGGGPAAPSITGFDLSANTIVYGPGGTVTAGLGIVIGTIYAGGPVVVQAQIDANTAYNYLVLQAPDTTYPGVTQLDGRTFTPGVYRFAPEADLGVNATVYLDFQGNSDALFIFQMGSTLKTLAGSRVIALNNNNSTCSGSNVYWAVGSSATINGAQFLGTVIATTAITMTSGANVSGRMLALGASVSMITDTISVCAGSGGTIPPPKPCRDFVTGGGWINGTSNANGHKNDKATFGVSGGIKNGKYWGQLSFNDHGKNGVKVKSTSVTAYIVIDPVTRQIEGFAKVNGKGSFAYTVVVVDKGEPGRNDFFSLLLSNNYSASGTLKGGNIQLHTKCGDSHDKDGKDDKENYDDKDERDGHDNCDHDSDRD
jgi:hypothetical protein